MKKILVLFTSVLLLISVTACSVKLTESQKAACDEVEELIQGLADLADNHGTKREIKKVDGNIVYFATIDYATEVEQSVAETINNMGMPMYEEILHKEDIYFVLYLNEDGENKYRMIDSQLDPSSID